jgi:hypothetical protein
MAVDRPSVSQGEARWVSDPGQRWATTDWIMLASIGGAGARPRIPLASGDRPERARESRRPVRLLSAESGTIAMSASGWPDDFIRRRRVAISSLDTGRLVGVLWRDWDPTDDYRWGRDVA